MQQFDYTKGKNASDIAMVIDIMDLLYTKDLSAIALVTSDSDFSPVVSRILIRWFDCLWLWRVKNTRFS